MKKWHWLEILILHSFLLIIAYETIADYPDVILWVGGICLTVLLIWLASLVKKGSPPLPLAICQALGIGIQHWGLRSMADQNLGLGGGLSLFFYQVMLAVFMIVTYIALLIGYSMRKKPD